MTGPDRQRLLRHAFDRALREIDPADRVRSACAPILGAASVDVVAVGKAACRMLAGLRLALDDRIRRGLLVTTDGTRCDGLDHRFTLRRAGHPLPDSRSVAAANEAIDFARSCRSELLVALVSGGTSSLLSSPFDASIEDLRALSAALLASGASIHEMNILRRHLGRAHGGRLAAEAPVPTFSLVVSDVIGGEVHDVGSGPTVEDPTTSLDAARVLQAVLPPQQASFWMSRLRETPKPATLARPCASFVVLRPQDLAISMAAQLEADGIRCRVDTILHATGDDLATRLVSEARQLDRGHACVVTCEPTMTLPADHGAGGRAGWVALSALCRLPEDTSLLAAASDGVDGTSGAGGACVSAEQARDLDRTLVERALRRRDDATVHANLGTHLPGLPSGLNLSDVYVVLRA
jgi:glycerate 2-kinase